MSGFGLGRGRGRLSCAASPRWRPSAGILQRGRGSIRNFDAEKGEISVGAGCHGLYRAGKPELRLSPWTPRYNYPFCATWTWRVRVKARVSESVRRQQRHHSAARSREPQGQHHGANTDPSSLFALAGLGYGAYFGTDELQDGADLDHALSAADSEWDRARTSRLQPRFTYRPVFGDELGDDDAEADSWTAVLDVGLPML